MSEWNRLKEKMDKILVDMSDIGFAIEFSKLWNQIEDEGDKLQEKADKLGDITQYPLGHFGRMTVLDYYDLVQLQADHYTERAIKAEHQLEAIRQFILECKDKMVKDAVLDILEDSDAGTKED